MIYTRVPKEAVPAVWDGLRALLDPSLALDTEDTEAGVYEALCEGQMTAWIGSGDAFGVLVTRVDEDEGRKTARMRYAAGKCSPKVMRTILADFEAGARQIGCDVVRLGGRQGWLRIARGYDVLSDENGHVELMKGL